MKKIYVFAIGISLVLLSTPVLADEGCRILKLHSKNIGLVCGSHIYAFPKADVQSYNTEKIVAMVNGEIKTFHLKKK